MEDIFIIQISILSLYTTGIHIVHLWIFTNWLPFPVSECGRIIPSLSINKHSTLRVTPCSNKLLYITYLFLACSSHLAGGVVVVGWCYTWRTYGTLRSNCATPLIQPATTPLQPCCNLYTTPVAQLLNAIINIVWSALQFTSDKSWFFQTLAHVFQFVDLSGAIMITCCSMY